MVPERQGHAHQMRGERTVVVPVAGCGVDPPAVPERVERLRLVVLGDREQCDREHDNAGVVDRGFGVSHLGQPRDEVGRGRQIAGRGRDDRPVGDRLRLEQGVVLLSRRFAAGDEARYRVVPLPQRERRLGVGHQRVRGPPPGAELVVEGLPVGAARLVDEIGVEQRETQEELGSERERSHGGRGLRQRRRATGVHQRVAEAAEPTLGHRQRRQCPDRARRIVRRLGNGEGTARRRFAGGMRGGERERPALLGEHQHLFRRSESGRLGETCFRDRDHLGRAVLERQRAEEREPDRDVDVGPVRAGEHGFGPRRRVGHPAGTEQRVDDLE